MTQYIYAIKIIITLIIHLVQIEIVSEKSNKKMLNANNYENLHFSLSLFFFFKSKFSSFLVAFCLAYYFFNMVCVRIHVHQYHELRLFWPCFQQ